MADSSLSFFLFVLFSSIIIIIIQVVLRRLFDDERKAWNQEKSSLMVCLSYKFFFFFFFDNPIFILKKKFLHILQSFTFSHYSLHKKKYTHENLCRNSLVHFKKKLEKERKHEVMQSPWQGERSFFFFRNDCACLIKI